MANITYVPTLAGFLYLAIVLDVFSRRIVGWAMQAHLRTELVTEVLEMAIEQRRPEAVVHHSDQGCQSRNRFPGWAAGSGPVEIEEESPAVLVFQHESGEALAGGVTCDVVAVRRGRLGQQRGDLGVVAVRAQPRTVPDDGPEPDEGVAVVVEGGRFGPRPPRCEHDVAVQD